MSSRAKPTYPGWRQVGHECQRYFGRIEHRPQLPVQTRAGTERIAPANDERSEAALDYLSADPIHIDDLVRDVRVASGTGEQHADDIRAKRACAIGRLHAILPYTKHIE